MATSQILEFTCVAAAETPTPYADHSLTARLTAPSGQVYDVTGFWDGGINWKLRFVADESGTWTWVTASDDPSLDSQTGSAEVAEGIDGVETAWKRHGPLAIGPTGRSFVHADGTPVFWLADTVWSAPAHATAEEWSTYVAHRAKQGYNVLQINALPQWDASGPPLREPFEMKGARADLTRANPAYFQALDAMVREAAEAGLICSMVVLWFDNTDDDNLDWARKVPRRGPFTTEDADRLGRYLAARYEAFGTTWIISGDSSFQAPNAVALYDAAGASVRAACARTPVMSAHLNGGTPPSEALHGRDWFDFVMFQSCHFRDSAERAIRYAATARAMTPAKPVLNSEPCYDSLQIMGDDNHDNQRFAREDVRKASWVSLLGGASAGLTYGAHGIWPWHRTGQTYGPMHYGLPPDWQEALPLDSGTDVVRLRTFFERLDWWDTVPADPLSTEPASAMVATAQVGDGMTLAYVAAPATVTLPGGPEPQATWFDPATGERQVAELTGDANAGWTVSPHGSAGDAVLELRS